MIFSSIMLFYSTFKAEEQSLTKTNKGTVIKSLQKVIKVKIIHHSFWTTIDSRKKCHYGKWLHTSTHISTVKGDQSLQNKISIELCELETVKVLIC